MRFRLLYKWLLFPLVFVLVSGLSVGQSARPISRRSISLAISAKPTLKVASPLVVSITLTNISGHDMIVERMIRGSDTLVDVRDSAGKWVPDTKAGKFFNGHNNSADLSQLNVNDLNDATVNLPVKAGKTVAWGLDVGRFYDLSKPGKYSIFIQRVDPEDPSLPGIKSNVITVSIIP
jgi:hypothetical protein